MNQQPASVYYHTHWDREWYLPFRTFQLRLADVVDEILERLETNVLPCFTLDGQVIVLDDYLALRPENRERLSRLIQNGRLDIGPWLVMPDEFLVSGESLVRNLLEGIRRSREWGCTRFTGYLPDTFGHSADIPTLLQQCGIDSAVVWRGVNPATSLFQWESPTGDVVKTLHLTDGYFQIASDDWTLTAAQKTEALNALQQKLETARHGDVPLLIPVGGDHMAPVPNEGRQLIMEALNGLQETTPTAYMNALTQANTWPHIQGELVDNSGSFLLPGVYSARMYLKQANRRLEHLLTHRLEPLLALAQLRSRIQSKAHHLVPAADSPTKAPRYPQQELAIAWETLILNHPHDSICGCSVDAVHRENEVRFDQVEQIAESLLCRTERQLAQTLPDGGAAGWLIHTGDQSYTGVVAVEEAYTLTPETEAVASSPSESASRLAQVARTEIVLQDGYKDNAHCIPMAHLTEGRRHGWVWADSLPAFSLQGLPEKTGLPAHIAPVEVTVNQLKNGCLTASIADDGTLTVDDAQNGQRKATQLLSFTDQPDQGDSYNSAPVPGTTPIRAEFTGARVVANGPLVGILELTHTFANGLALLTQVRLAADSTRLDFETTFTNTLPRHKLQVGFPTGAPVKTVLAESHFSQVLRQYDPQYSLASHMPVAKNRELKTNTGPVQRFFSTNGHGWITEGLAEYEVYRDTIQLTLLRAFSALSAADTGVRGAQAGPPLPTPEGECLQRTIVARYAWLPLPDAKKEASASLLYKEADRFYGNAWGYIPAQPTQEETEKQITAPSTSSSSTATSKALEAFSLLSWDDEVAITASACYWQPGQGLVLRLLNTHTEPVTTTLRPGFACNAAYMVNFLEEIQGELPPTVLPTAGSLPQYRVTLPRNGVQTLLFKVD
jgi:mannosylglycerate hydrolase